MTLLYRYRRWRALREAHEMTDFLFLVAGTLDAANRPEEAGSFRKAARKFLVAENRRWPKC